MSKPKSVQEKGRYHQQMVLRERELQVHLTPDQLKMDQESNCRQITKGTYWGLSVGRRCKELSWERPTKLTQSTQK